MLTNYSNCKTSQTVWYFLSTVPAGQLDKNSACACKGRQCGCCIRLDVEAIGLDSTGKDPFCGLQNARDLYQ